METLSLRTFDPRTLDPSQVEEDTDRDRYMSPLEAKAYGLIDVIVGGDDAGLKAGFLAIFSLLFLLFFLLFFFSFFSSFSSLFSPLSSVYFFVIVGGDDAGFFFVFPRSFWPRGSSPVRNAKAHAPRPKKKN